MDPVRTLAAYLLLAIVSSAGAQQAPALQSTPAPAAVYAPAYTVEPRVQEDADEETEASTPAPEEAEATAMPGGITRDLYRRLTGDDVATVQQKLIDLGYLKGKADGVFGRDTYSAVIKFQLAHDLEPDGIVGVNTLTWLFSGEAIALPTATPAPTPVPTSAPTPSPSPSPDPTATPVPTAQVPQTWADQTQENSPVDVKEDCEIQADGEAIEGIAVYVDAQGGEFLPLRALIHALSFPEQAHADGGAYEFTVPSTQTQIALGCDADAQGVVAQTMVMIGGYLFVPETPYTLLRWGEEIYVPLQLWNEVVKSPELTIVQK